MSSDWGFRKFKDRAQYKLLDGGESLGEVSKAQPQFQLQKPYWKHALFVLPWCLTLIFALSTFWLGSRLDQSNSLGSFAKGWRTDLSSAHTIIQAQRTTFTGSPSFFENKTMYIPHADPIQYNGPPSQQIDKNWEKLTWGRYILITDEEAHSAWGENIEDYWDEQRGGYVAGLDMFHTLHCLNNLRKALHPEYYGAVDHSAHAVMHQDHCLEQLRQYIMCSGDMTPVPTRYYAALGRNYVDSDVPHTCRNFKKLQTWMVDRYEGPTAVQPRSRPGRRR